MSKAPVLLVENLSVRFGDDVHAVRGVTLEVAPATVHAVVGESGSGKSVSAKALLGLLPSTAHTSADQLVIGGTEVSVGNQASVATVRGKTVAMVFQEPGKHLNPSFTVGALIGEALRRHAGLSGDSVGSRVRELLTQVELDPDAVSRAYPHELSGGMKQRALIALAVSCNPALLIADEPTTSLDVTVQAQIVRLLDRLRTEMDMAVLFISHDLGLVQSVADVVSVMYAGRIVDSAAADDMFSLPLHPYTSLLLDSIPSPESRGSRLQTIPGRVPDAGALPPGCAFHPRCPLAHEVCTRVDPELTEHEPGHASACHFADHLLESSHG
jgi:oligopeptide/dipeptide ABC transporter ATP-binding protein